MTEPGDRGAGRTARPGRLEDAGATPAATQAERLAAARKPKRRRHPAAAGRILAAGISASLTFGLTGAFAQAAKQAAANAAALEPPASTVPPRLTAVQVAGPASAPPPTHARRVAGTRATLPTATTRATPKAVTTTRAAATVTSALPATRPAPVTTSHGSTPR